MLLGLPSKAWAAAGTTLFCGGILAGSLVGYLGAPEATPTAYCEDDTCETFPGLGFDAGEQWCADAGGSGTSCDGGTGSCTTFVCEDAETSGAGPTLALPPPSLDVEYPSEHPLPASLPRGDDAQMLAEADVPASWSANLGSRWRSVRDAIVGAQPRIVIDLTGGMGRTAFDRILDVELGEAGTIYVLEAHPTRTSARRIVAYDSSGRFIGQVDQAADAENRLSVPRATTLVGGDRLGVAQQHGGVSVFAPLPGGFRFEDAIPVEPPPSDICAAGERIFVTQRRSLLAIRELEPGRRQSDHSFGSVYDQGSGLARNALSEGVLACLRAPDRVVFGFRAIPRLDAYDADSGQLVWTAGVADFAQGIFSERLRPRHGITSPVNYPRERLARLLPVRQDLLLAVYLRSHLDPTERVEIRTYLIDAATGRGAMLSDTLPLIAAISGDTFVTLSTDPAPTLMVMQR